MIIDHRTTIGDIATFPCDSQANIPIRVEHWSVGLNTGRCAGKRIAGHAEPYITVPFFWTVSKHSFVFIQTLTHYD
jgi:hypothetical protein